MWTRNMPSAHKIYTKGGMAMWEVKCYPIKGVGYVGIERVE